MIVASIGKLILRNKYIFTFSSYVLMLKKKKYREKANEVNRDR